MTHHSCHLFLNLSAGMPKVLIKNTIRLPEETTGPINFPCLPPGGSSGIPIRLDWVIRTRHEKSVKISIKITTSLIETYWISRKGRERGFFRKGGIEDSLVKSPAHLDPPFFIGKDEIRRLQGCPKTQLPECPSTGETMNGSHGMTIRNRKISFDILSKMRFSP